MFSRSSQRTLVTGGCSQGQSTPGKLPCPLMKATGSSELLPGAGSVSELHLQRYSCAHHHLCCQQLTQRRQKPAAQIWLVTLGPALSILCALSSKIVSLAWKSLGSCEISSLAGAYPFGLGGWQGGGASSHALHPGGHLD